MTPRQRRERLLQSFSPRDIRSAFETLCNRRGLLELLTDEAVDAFARQIVHDNRFRQAMNRANRSAAPSYSQAAE